MSVFRAWFRAVLLCWISPFSLFVWVWQAIPKCFDLFRENFLLSWFLALFNAWNVELAFAHEVHMCNRHVSEPWPFVCYVKMASCWTFAEPHLAKTDTLASLPPLKKAQKGNNNPQSNPISKFSFFINGIWMKMGSGTSPGFWAFLRGAVWQATPKSFYFSEKGFTFLLIHSPSLLLNECTLVSNQYQRMPAIVQSHSQSQAGLMFVTTLEMDNSDWWMHISH